MSNVNYTKFSEEEKMVEAPVVEEAVIEEPEIEEEIEEEVEEPEIEEEVVGVVVDCARLNVRKEPSKNAAVAKIINAGARVKIVDDSEGEFYKVQVAGITGFCMKEFITVE